MLFEAVLVTALLFAYLAVPAKTLEAFRTHFVGDIFGAADFCFWHGERGGGGISARLDITLSIVTICAAGCCCGVGE